MGREGFEPSTLAGYGSEPYAYASSATCPLYFLDECARMESDHRPLSYQDSVLPLNYTRPTSPQATKGRGTIAKYVGRIKQKSQALSDRSRSTPVGGSRIN